MTKPLFAENVLGLTLVHWLHFERFQNTKVRQFCLKLRVIGRRAGIIIINIIIINHAVDAAFYIC